MQNTKKKEQKIQSKEESIEVILPNWTMINDKNKELANFFQFKNELWECFILVINTQF